jgi:hypothetical protein
MMAAAEDTVSVTFCLTKDAKCPTNTEAALQPQVSILRRNCDGSIRRDAAPTRNLYVTRTVCAGDGIFKATVTAPYVKMDACLGIAIKLADSTSRLAIVKYT